MTGTGKISTMVDNIFGSIVGVLEVVIEFLVNTIFSNNVVTIAVFLIFVNVLAIILMKKDKQYAETPDARRIKESTLLTVALVGGGLGEYYAMFKYKHKTLHNNFLFVVPLAILLNTAMYTFLVFMSLMT